MATCSVLLRLSLFPLCSCNSFHYAMDALSLQLSLSLLLSCLRQLLFLQHAAHNASSDSHTASGPTTFPPCSLSTFALCPRCSFKIYSHTIHTNITYHFYLISCGICSSYYFCSLYLFYASFCAIFYAFLSELYFLVLINLLVSKEFLCILFVFNSTVFYGHLFTFITLISELIISI